MFNRYGLAIALSAQLLQRESSTRASPVDHPIPTVGRPRGSRAVASMDSLTSGVALESIFRAHCKPRQLFVVLLLCMAQFVSGRHGCRPEGQACLVTRRHWRRSHSSDAGSSQLPTDADSGDVS
jgi:hypothetical protein